MARLDLEALVERRLEPAVHGVDRQRDGDGALRQHLPEHRARRVEQLPRGHHRVHETDAVRFRGVDHVARQNELERPALAHEPRESLRAAVAGTDAELHLREAEARVVRRDTQVTGEGQLAPPA